MAKSRINADKLTLTPKKAIVKPAAEEDKLKAAEQAVRDIHTEEATSAPAQSAPPTAEVKNPEPPAAKAKKAPAAAKPKEAKAVGGGTKRITFDIPKGLHREVRLFCLHADMSIKDFLQQCVENELQRRG